MSRIGSRPVYSEKPTVSIGSSKMKRLTEMSPMTPAEHSLQLRRLHLTGHDHDLFKQREFLVGVLDAQKVAAVHIAS